MTEMSDAEWLETFIREAAYGRRLRSARLLEAASAVYDWLDREGMYNELVDALEAAIKACKETR